MTKINIYIYQTIFPDIKYIRNVVDNIEQNKYNIIVNIITNDDTIIFFPEKYINVIKLPKAFSYPKIWNYCIIHGFENLKDPKCDYIILLNTINLLTTNNINTILPLLNKYDFINPISSNECIIVNPLLLSHIGLFDENMPKSFDIDIIIRSLYYKNTYNKEICLYFFNDIQLESFLNIKYIQDINLHLDTTLIDKWKINTCRKLDLTYLLDISNSTRPSYNSVYPGFDNDIIIKKLNPNKVLENDRLYMFYNVKSKMYINLSNISQKNNRSVTVGSNGEYLRISTTDNKNYYIKLKYDLINQNNTLGWHLYTVPYNDDIYGAGNNGIWAIFHFEQDNLDPTIWYIRAYHNETDNSGVICRYLFINDNNEIKTNGIKNASSQWQFL